MVGSLPARLLRIHPALLVGIVASLPAASHAQEPAAPDANLGQFFLIEEPIDSEVLERIKAATKQMIARSNAQKAPRPILVFEIRPGQAQPGSSGFGTSFELANFISTELAGAKLTVAYVPQPLKGYAVLPALACDEVVMGPDGSVGPITPEELRGHAPTIATRSASSPAGRAGISTSSPGCSTATPTSGRPDRPIARSTTSCRTPARVPQGQPGRREGHPARLGGREPRGPRPPGGPARRGSPSSRPMTAAEIANVYRIGSRPSANDPTLLQDPAGLDPDRRPARLGQGGVPPPADRPGPPASGSTSSSSRSTARAG